MFYKFHFKCKNPKLTTSFLLFLLLVCLFRAENQEKPVEENNSSAAEVSMEE